MATSKTSSALTPEQEKQYIQGGGIKCPFCGSAVETNGIAEINLTEAVQEVNCTKCKASWDDVYRLVELRDVQRSPRKRVP